VSVNIKINNLILIKFAMAEPKYINLQQCPLCGSYEKKLLFKATDVLMRKPGEFGIEECTECSFRFTNPRISIEDIFNYYTTDYHCYKGEQSVPKKNLINEIDLSKSKTDSINLKKIDIDYELVGGFWGCRAWVLPKISSGATVLELGCGNGSFIKVCVSRQWKTIGSDLNPDLENVIKAIGGDFIYTELPKIELPDNSLDAVFAWQVLEHLYEPIETLREIERVLKPDGIFAFSVPNSDCWQFKFFKDKWAGLQVPTHISHFSEKTICQLVEKSGLQIVEIYEQNTIGCLYPSILLWMGQKNVSLSDQWTPISLINKGVDRVISILVGLILGKNQAERLTVVCIRK
jgi:SAM-dependent methyltransferase